MLKVVLLLAVLSVALAASKVTVELYYESQVRASILGATFNSTSATSLHSGELLDLPIFGQDI